MSLALFDILTGSFAAELEGSATDKRIESVQQHLHRLLNARRGSLHHLPDYGMPDLGAVYENLPYSVESLAHTVKDLVERFEPRLSRIEVRHQGPVGEDRRIKLEISARLADLGEVCFQTVFESAGSARVNPAPRRGGHA